MTNLEQSYENSIEMGFYVNKMTDLSVDEIAVLKKILDFRRSSRTELVRLTDDGFSCMWIRAIWIQASFASLGNTRKVRKALKKLEDKGYIENILLRKKTDANGIIRRGSFSCIRVLPKTDTFVVSKKNKHHQVKLDSDSFIQAEEFSTANQYANPIEV